ncbi:MAG: purine-nucleoside phosphorylase [Bdellovibrio sp.]|nr:purine-nucleoside phosphorylase [Bdellovibrio sp.]
MTQNTIYQKIKKAVDLVKQKSDIPPEIGIILGSGLGSVAEKAKDTVHIPYLEIPFFHGTTVEGHSGKMTIGKLFDVPCVLLQGRFHLYEGYDMEDVVFPTRTLCGLGIHTLILTNAAGSINPNFQPGDVMVISDHLNLMGNNPLQGIQVTQLGPRFPDLSEAYNKKCINIIENVTKDLGISLKHGVYAGLMGPTYETPAEVRMLRTLGADAVGMSTVPECIAANHLGVRVLGISCIANLAAGQSPQKLTHHEVLESSKLAANKLSSILEKAIPLLVHKPSKE